MKIDKKEIDAANKLLKNYKAGKSNLESRIVEEEMFWKRRHWEVLRKDDNKSVPTSAWMFNSIANKHADAMDAYPEVKCLPREKSDEESAQAVTSIIPVILQRNGFEDTYSNNWWYKLKHGCAAYGVFWDNAAENGLGDVLVKKIDLLNIFWEPGITDIQQSSNLFIVDLVPTHLLRAAYPKATFSGSGSEVLKQYIYDDNVDTSEKTLVIDWYYKKTVDGQSVLHFCKYAEDNVLFASENEKDYAKRGWYDDGEYPIEFDVLYPEEGTPIGFGVISLTRDAQLYIDKLDNAIMDYTYAAAHPRYFAKESSGINVDDFLNLNKAIVTVAGDLDDKKVKQIVVNPLNGYVMNFRAAKIDEMKETSSNRDFSNGSTMGGVTSGAAIATLQEAGNKTSRDMISASYRAYVRIAQKIVERMRQFYTEARTFRIIGSGEKDKYINFDNSSLVPQSVGVVAGEELFREPIFDIDVRAQKHNPYSTLSQNETAMNLYNAGFFNPQNAQMALAALKVMDFDGKKDIEEYINQGQTLMRQMQSLMQENEQMKGALLGGQNMPVQRSTASPMQQMPQMPRTAAE